MRAMEAHIGGRQRFVCEQAEGIAGRTQCMHQMEEDHGSKQGSTYREPIH